MCSRSGGVPYSDLQAVYLDGILMVVAERFVRQIDPDSLHVVSACTCIFLGGVRHVELRICFLQANSTRLLQAAPADGICMYISVLRTVSQPHPCG